MCGRWERWDKYNEENVELNSGCCTSSNEPPLRALNTMYVVTVTFDTAANVGKIYVDGLLRKQCPVGSNAAYGPRTLQFSYLGQSAHYSKRFIGNLYRLAVYDRSLGVEEIVYQHQTLKSNVAVATIAMVGSTLYEFQLNYSAVNFSRVGLMVSILFFFDLVSVLHRTKVHSAFNVLFRSKSVPVVVWRRIHCSPCLFILQSPDTFSRKPVFCCSVSCCNLRFFVDGIWSRRVTSYCWSCINVLHPSSRFSWQCETRCDFKRWVRCSRQISWWSFKGWSWDSTCNR